MLRHARVAEDQIAEAMAFFHRRATRLRRGDDLEEVLAIWGRLRLPATGDAERGPRIPDLMDMLVTWLRRALRSGRG